MANSKLKEMFNLNSERVFFSLTEGGGANVSTLFKLVKTRGKVNIWEFFCKVNYNQISEFTGAILMAWSPLTLAHP